MIPLVLLLLLIATILFVAARELRKRGEREAGGRVVYSDLRMRGQLLVSERLGLVGKPDYILKRGEYLIPVEVKSSLPPDRPYRSHVLQLAAYCMLIEECFGVGVPYGYIEYAGNRKYKVEFDAGLRAELGMVLMEMREAIETGKVRADPSPAKCRACSVRNRCPVAFSHS